MMKVRCSCGATLSVDHGVARFRCPECQKILKLPKPSEGDGGPAAPLPAEADGQPRRGGGRAALVSRLQLGLAGALLIGLAAPIQGDRAVVDALWHSLNAPQRMDLLDLARLLMPLGAALALLGALAPLRGARGMLVAGVGLAMAALTFGHMAAHPAFLERALRIAQLVPPQQLLGFGLLATLLSLVMLAAAQTRCYHPDAVHARTTSVTAGIAFCATPLACSLRQRN